MLRSRHYCCLKTDRLYLLQQRLLKQDRWQFRLCPVNNYALDERKTSAFDAPIAFPYQSVSWEEKGSWEEGSAASIDHLRPGVNSSSREALAFIM